MTKCPFWSNQDQIVSCYEECPMNGCDEDCVFKTHLSNNVYKSKNVVSKRRYYQDFYLGNNDNDLIADQIYMYL